jgi:hypothetical protein
LPVNAISQMPGRNSSTLPPALIVEPTTSTAPRVPTM